MIPLLTLTSREYVQAVRERLGKGGEHARLLYREWLQTGEIKAADPHFRNAGILLEKIKEITDFSYLTCYPAYEEGNTVKYLFLTHDQLEFEMVVLPMKAGYTLCLSSQVGCRMGCAFCETGKMGLIRSLTTQEILSQVFAAKFVLGIDVRNLVFMGMGEPLDNFDNVVQALRILTDENGFSMGSSRITLSTSGLVPYIYKLLEVKAPPVHLAISVNGSSDAIRGKLMPINRQHDMAALKTAMHDYQAATGKKILIEYVMIEGKTDGLEAAHELAAYLESLEVTVNLIPYNPQSRAAFIPAPFEKIEAFAQLLRQEGYLTFVRTTKGQSIMAACGQLGNRSLRRQKSTKLA